MVKGLGFDAWWDDSYFESYSNYRAELSQVNGALSVSTNSSFACKLLNFRPTQQALYPDHGRRLGGPWLHGRPGCS